MYGTAAAAAAAALSPRLPLRSAARAAAADGTSAYSMAMHMHSSFSEQSGSMDSQLFQAATNSVDVLWWTDHDYRMDGIGYRETVHFTSLTAESGGLGQGGPWTLANGRKRAAGERFGRRDRHQPLLPERPGGRREHAPDRQEHQRPRTAKFGYYANCHPAGWNYRDSLTGQSLTIDVLLASGWTRGYLELLIATSYHEAAAAGPPAITLCPTGSCRRGRQPSPPGIQGSSRSR